MKITRRNLLGAALAALATATLSKPAGAAAEFEFKLGVNTPDTHPLTVRLVEAARAIGEQSSGRLNVTVFPNSQLGGDPEMLSQLRAGGIDLLAAPSLTLSTLVPLSGLPSIGFAFQSYDQVWAAMDGGVGDVIRDAIGKAGIVPMKKIWDNGFRQITSSSSRQLNSVDDLRGFKIRVPVTALLTSLFSGLGALPSSISYSELYSALQTHIVEGQENPLAPSVDRQAVRGAEILRAVEPLLERLLDRRQPPRAGKSARGPAGDRQQQFRCRGRQGT